MHSDVHCSYFTSLGISSPSGQEHTRARIWPVLSREKNAQKELLIYAKNCRNPTLAKCGGEAQHLEKVRTWSLPGLPNVQSSTGRPKTPRIGVFLVSLEKVLKRRYRKWPRIGHLDICRPSYGQKKGRESNCQFDSRPLKVKNRPLPDLRMESAIRR